MTIGQVANLKIYEEQFYGGMFEAVAQNCDAFNAASQNTLQLVRKDLLGQYNKESFWQAFSGLISRRNLASVSAATDQPMTQEELVGVKINRKVGPVCQAVGALLKIGSDQKEMSFILGKMFGEEKLKDMLNTALIAVEAALQGQTSLIYNHSGTITHAGLVSGLALMGDRADRIRCWVMHSAPYFDLMSQAISDKITNIADVVIMQGTVATMGRPVILTDSSALYGAVSGSGSANTYSILGLVEGGVVATESEEELVASDLVTGLEQLSFRVQAEYAFNLLLKGFQWDTSNGGANPTDSSLRTATNWDKVATSIKDCAGVRITCS